MPGSSSTWKELKRLPWGWNPPPPRPEGAVPVAGDQVLRRGVFEGKTEEMAGEITEVYARKGSSRTMFRWLARIRWADGKRNEVRVERLTLGWDQWILVTEGKKTWM